MLKVKSFKLDEDVAFNKFVAEHTPSEKGLIINESGMVVLYPDPTEDVLTTGEVIVNINDQIRNHKKRIVEYKKTKILAQLTLKKAKERLIELEKEREELSYEDKAENSKRIKTCEEIIGGANQNILTSDAAIEEELKNIEASEILIKEYLAEERHTNAKVK